MTDLIGLGAMALCLWLGVKLIRRGKLGTVRAPRNVLWIAVACCVAVFALGSMRNGNAPLARAHEVIASLTGGGR